GDHEEKTPLCFPRAETNENEHASSQSAPSGLDEIRHRNCEIQSLVNQFERELHLARRARRPANETEARASHNVSRKSKVDKIENVEKLSAELQCQLISSSSTPKGSVLD